MSSVFKRSVKDLAKSGWIDDLTEEEEAVLKHSAELDNYMKSGKLNKKIKIGILDE